MLAAEFVDLVNDDNQSLSGQVIMQDRSDPKARHLTFELLAESLSVFCGQQAVLSDGSCGYGGYG
ncbi:MAG: hypothetical protein EOO77_41015 [Oxalobacteraceae bacterium]|nr:MAG: hypothetical protein EOO77_41015 [Oxalobacteraceae bacterium]